MRKILLKIMYFLFPEFTKWFQSASKVADEIVLRTVMVDVSNATINFPTWEGRINTAAKSKFASIKLFNLRKKILDLNSEADNPNVPLEVRDANALVISRLLSLVDDARKRIKAPFDLLANIRYLVN